MRDGDIRGGSDYSNFVAEEAAKHYLRVKQIRKSLPAKSNSAQRADIERQIQAVDDEWWVNTAWAFAEDKRQSWLDFDLKREYYRLKWATRERGEHWDDRLHRVGLTTEILAKIAEELRREPVK